MPSPRKTKPALKPERARSLIVQSFQPSSIAGLDLLRWYYSLPQFFPATPLLTVAQQIPQVNFRQDVLALALEYFVRSYGRKTPAYVRAPSEKAGKFTSMRVPSDLYVGIKVIAERDSVPIEHAVETAIQVFLARVLTPEMRERHQQVMKDAIDLLRLSERRRQKLD